MNEQYNDMKDCADMSTSTPHFQNRGGEVWQLVDGEWREMFADKIISELTEARQRAEKAEAALDFLKTKGLTVGPMKSSDRPEPYLVYLIESGSELDDTPTIRKLIDAEIQLAALQSREEQLVAALKLAYPLIATIAQNFDSQSPMLRSNQAAEFDWARSEISRALASSPIPATNPVGEVENTGKTGLDQVRDVTEGIKNGLFYSYDPYAEFLIHESAEAAKAAFESAVDYRKEALSDGDCDDNMADISWGPVSQRLSYEDRELTAEEKECYDFAFIREISIEDLSAGRGGWLPIESAPKDGTIILGAYKGHVGAVVYQKDCGFVTMPGRYHRPVTHWQPLPNPPEAGEVEG